MEVIRDLLKEVAGPVAVLLTGFTGWYTVKQSRRANDQQTQLAHLEVESKAYERAKSTYEEVLNRMNSEIHRLEEQMAQLQEQLAQERLDHAKERRSRLSLERKLEDMSHTVNTLRRLIEAADLIIPPHLADELGITRDDT